jgi:hypothetical protein
MMGKEEDDNHPFLWVPSIERAVDPRPKEDSFKFLTRSSQEMVLPLLLFLAGCHLDAGEFQMARKTLAVRCPRCLLSIPLHLFFLYKRDS